MLSVKTDGPKTTIRQIPVILYLAVGVLCLPMILMGLVSPALGADAGGAAFSILFGLGFGWLLFEFVATREDILIDLEAREFRRSVKGLLRVKEQQISLHAIDKVVLETVRPRGRARYHILLQGPLEEHLINSPSIVYLDHPANARLLSETLNLPLVELEAAGMKWR